MLGKEAMEAVPGLIDALSADEAGLRYQISEALRGITGEDFGTDSGLWQAW